jgi:hypothetical protein
MEKYPGELLVGVFPLIFCVDATLQKANTTSISTTTTTTSETSPTAGQDDTSTVEISDADKIQKQRSSSISNRSQFDRFLDAMAASLMDDPDDEYDQAEFPGGFVPHRTTSYDSSGNQKDGGGGGGATIAHPLSLGGSGGGGGDHHPNQNNNPLTSLFRGDESDDNDSDIEDDLILGSSTPTTARHGNGGDVSYFGNNSLAGGVSRRGSRDNQQHRPSLPKIGLPRIGSVDNRNNNNSVGGGTTSLDTSFAQALQQGQSFFQRARIISISSRHGFPPSKDPTGQRNRIQAYFDNGTRTSGNGSLVTSKLLAATQKHPIDGILPSGWLEKHAAALPSVILVIVQIGQHQVQSDQDQLLLDTLENLQHSLAPKRQVLIQVVGLVQEDISQIYSEQWAQTMERKLASSAADLQNHPKPIIGVGGTGGTDDPPKPIVLLPVSDLQPDASYSVVMQQLHERVRNASFEYYWNRCKDVKQKLCRLGPARRTPLLLPLSIRYCFKVSMFYEFQWKQEKSLKYMLEAYRLLETYYGYILQQREVAQDNDDANAGNDISDSKYVDDNRTESKYSHTTAISDRSDGVELSITTSNTTSGRSGGIDDPNTLPFQTTPPAEDMVYQCRAVADWLNFKILQHGLVSNTEGGLIAASMQMQRHAHAFCSPRRSFIFSPSAPWLDWSFVSQQWLVVSQLLERHPPRVMGDLGGDHDEVLARCSSWRTYEAAASSLLRAGKLVHSFKDRKPGELQLGFSSKKGKKGDVSRTRYVGGIDHDEGFFPALEEELKINHMDQALSCANRGLSLLQKDNQQISEKDSKMQVWSRASTRLHYLAGGTLLSMGKYTEALTHIVEATNLCSGWSGLEKTMRRMLIECFQNIPDDSFGTLDIDTLVPMILDSLFAAKLRVGDLQSALKRLSAISGAGTEKDLIWKRECVDESDHTLPYSFAVTFPNVTHATAGDGVEVCLWIRSNLDVATQVNSVALHSSIGTLEIPSSDLLSAKNTALGQDGDLILEANKAIKISTKIYLPSDVCEIGTDEAEPVGENKSPGANAYLKSARPRTSGITAAAGARFVSEDSVDGESDSKNAQWSQRCLGGRSLSCDGIEIAFHPICSKSAVSPNNTSIDLIIKKIAPKSDTKVKRTPFEEENYIAPAWNRPMDVPLDQGPRCLRALNPTATMTMYNVTEHATNGRALEGTVNRILLKLTAGEVDCCSDIKVWIKSSSALIGADGTTKSIAVIGDDNLLLDNSVDMKEPGVRSPVLVVPNPSPSGILTSLGFDLPGGWDLFGTNGQGDELYNLNIQNIKCGESAFVFFDVFRPTPSPTHVESVQRDNSVDSDFDRRMCRTNVEVSVTYNQSRSIYPKSGERSSDNDVTSVTLFDTVSLLWSAPISAHFSPVSKEAFPSGNRHPSNFVPDVASGRIPGPQPAQEMVLIDKERVTTRCTMEAIASADGLEVEIEEVRFSNSPDRNSPCSFDLLSGLDDDREKGMIYHGTVCDVGRKLSVGSKFVVSWTSRVNMQTAYLKGSVTSTLGELLVYWRPPSMNVPEDAEVYDANSNLIHAHGPLALPSPSLCRFEGPPCYIENSPFEAYAEQMPDTIRLSEPFDVAFSIVNKTPLDQHLDIRISSADKLSDGISKEYGGFLVSGLMNGSVNLGPFEKHTFSFTVVPTQVGEVALPQVSVASTRYKTWVIHEASAKRFVFVIP